MKKLITLAISTLVLSASVAFAQLSSAPGTANQPGKSPAVGEKESYTPSDPNKTGGGTTSPTKPGVTGAGANVTDKETYATQDPSRTGNVGAPTNPATAGTKTTTKDGQ